MYAERSKIFREIKAEEEKQETDKVALLQQHREREAEGKGL